MDNIIGNINTTSTENGNSIIKSTNSIFSSSFYFQDYYDDKLTNKFIKCTEAIIRQSKEYNDYLALIKTNYNVLNFDNILSHISDGDATIEIHHCPFTLYNIVDILMTYHISKKENFTSFSLAQEVMNLHFKHKVGFVPLTKTHHELVHSGGLFISSNQIFGEWRSLMTDYKEGISEEIKEKIKRFDALSEKKLASDFRGIY